MKILFLLFVSCTVSWCVDIAPIPSYCSNSSITDTWEKYVCEVAAARLQPDCMPQRLWAGTGPSDTTAKGLVVMFHGYTACSQAYSTYAKTFQAAGFHVLNVLNEGHGRAYNDCPNADCVNKDPVEGLPQNRSKYVAFVDRINNIVTDHVDRLITRGGGFITMVVGHSLGGGLATIAAVHGNSGEKKLYDKLLLLAPFLGITVPDLDRSVQDCSDKNACISLLVQGAVDKVLGQQPSNSSVSSNHSNTGWGSLVDLLKSEILRQLPDDIPVSDHYNVAMSVARHVFTLLAETRPTLPENIQQALGTGMGWGDQCETDRISNKTNRAGYCNFRVYNLLAVHSQGQYALSKVDTLKHPIITQLVGVQRDGNNRNSLAWQVLQAFDRNSRRITGSTSSQSSACLFRVVPDCNMAEKANECGVPHAFVAGGDTLGVPPYSMYWEEDLLNQILGFLQEGTPVGSSSFGQPIVNKVCEKQDLSNPPALLVAPVVRVVNIILDATVASITKKVREQVVQAIATATGIPVWLISMIEIPKEVVAGSQVLLTVTLPANVTLPTSQKALGGMTVVSISDPLVATITTNTIAPSNPPAVSLTPGLATSHAGMQRNGYTSTLCALICLAPLLLRLV